MQKKQAKALKKPAKEMKKPLAKKTAKAAPAKFSDKKSNENKQLKNSVQRSVRSAPTATAVIVKAVAAPKTTASARPSAGVMTRPGFKPVSSPTAIQHRSAPLPQGGLKGVPAKAPANMNGAAMASVTVEYRLGDYVVYPAHGVGQIEAIESQTIASMQIKLYAIRFEKDRMLLKIPVFKAQAAGLRKLSSSDRLKDAMKTLQGKARIKRTMWSRRAQEYEMKINSGDPVSIAEVLRDLKRSNDDTEQSYSERQIYQSALERLAREVAAVQSISEIQAAEQLEKFLRKVA